MKKTDRTIKLVSLLLFLALAAYITVYIIGSLTDSTQTSPAVMTTVVDSGRSEGLIVRSETVVMSALPYLDLQVQEDKHVSTGETIAVSYGSEDGLSQAEKIHALQLQIAQARNLLQNGQADTASNTEAAIRSATFALSRAVTRGDAGNLAELSQNLSSLLFGGAQLSQADLDSLQAQLSALQNAAPAGGETPIVAEQAGTFSTVLDGFENIGPSALQNLTPAGVDTLLTRQKTPPSGAIGKLITSQIWYYAAKLSAADGARLRVGQNVAADFGRYLDQPVSLHVEQISEESNGERAVLFSCEQALASTLSFRAVTAEIAFAQYSGLRVPAAALRTEVGGTLAALTACNLNPPSVAQHTALDNSCYVYTYTVLYAEKKVVHVVYTGGDYVLVSVDPDGGALREGDQIIVSGTDLYDGKMLK